MNVPFSGGCACGAIRYESSAAPVLSVNCHCRDCQRASGSAYAAIVAVPAAAFRMQGEPRYRVSKADSGTTMRRGFCGDCGSPLVIFEVERPGVALIQVASLDDPSTYRPMMDLYTASAHPWDVMSPELPKYPGMPPLPEGV